MLRDVKHNVSDGLLGFATPTGDGLHIKVGVSPVVSDTPIIVTGDMDAAMIKKRLGLSPWPMPSWTLSSSARAVSTASLLPPRRREPSERSQEWEMAAAA
jgi:hypothetical protein